MLYQLLHHFILALHENFISAALDMLTHYGRLTDLPDSDFLKFISALRLLDELLHASVALGLEVVHDVGSVLVRKVEAGVRPASFYDYLLLKFPQLYMRAVPVLRRE